MKQNYLIILFAIGLSLFSCEKYTEPLDFSIQPGHILCSDGSIIMPSKIDETKTPIGVVFWANSTNDQKYNAKAFAVGLKDIAPTEWASRNVHIPNTSSDLNDFEGVSNTVAMIAHDLKDSLTEVTSVRLVEKYMLNSSWFIPSAGQLRELYKQKENVNNSLKLIQGENLGNWYWSSTEDGTSEDAKEIFSIIVSIHTGSVNHSNKKNKYAIRPVIAIM